VGGKIFQGKKVLPGDAGLKLPPEAVAEIAFKNGEENSAAFRGIQAVKLVWKQDDALFPAQLIGVFLHRDGKSTLQNSQKLHLPVKMGGKVNVQGDIDPAFAGTVLVKKAHEGSFSKCGIGCLLSDTFILAYFFIKEYLV